MTTINDLLYWCSQFRQQLNHQSWPMLENQVPLLLRTLMTNVPLTMFLSFSTLICSCFIFRSLTVGNWGWTRALLMILLFLVGMAGMIFVVHEI